MSENEKITVKKREVNWLTVLYYLHIHVLGTYGLWLLIVSAKWMTVFFTFALIMIGILGLTAGAHRYWAHNSYKAFTPIRFLLMLAHTTTGVGTIHNWVINHRIHHKYYGTDKDPYNHKKGFIYSHIMSNIFTQHPDQEAIQKTIDTRDIELDAFVWIQQKLYIVIFIFIGLLLPVNTPVEYWDESLATSFFILVFFRIAVTVNAASLINSGLLVWGLKETDKYPPDDNLVFYLNRNFWPRYHYFVPWDWKTGEYGTYDADFTSFAIAAWHKLGLISELKTNSGEDVQEALYKLASKRGTLTSIFSDLKKEAEYEALKKKLRYKH